MSKMWRRLLHPSLSPIFQTHWMLRTYGMNFSLLDESLTHSSLIKDLNKSKLDNIKSIQLNDDDLILVEDSSTIVLIKVKEIETISNMYHVCQAEAFVDVKIHYVVGLRVWLQFSSVNSCEAFKSNESLNKLWTFIKVPSPSFVVDERVIWIEVSGLPLFKESDLKDSKEGDQANVSTHVAGDNETLFSGKVKEEYFVTKKDKPSEEDVSDTSKPPGFENFIKENSECSISSNASRSVGGTLGYDVKGCKKSLRKMINGIGVSMADK
nr:RNA-directed DNA polymerase, eukaryota, reverse transcriptase zinc-binding domain protein [Tanacetum cinerariifolium]